LTNYEGQFIQCKFTFVKSKHQIELKAFIAKAKSVKKRLNISLLDFEMHFFALKIEAKTTQKC